MTVIIGGSGTANGISYFSTPTTFGGTLATASRGISAASVPSGCIIQVQSYTHTAYFSTTTHGGPSGSGTVTPLTVSITPKSSTSNILVICNFMPGCITSSTLLGKITRTGASTASSPGTTNTNYAGWASQTYLSTANIMFPTAAIQWLDSPSTVATTTYTLIIAGNTVGATVAINSGIVDAYSTYGGTSTITAFEIAQ